jgi:hypothetical protein
MVPEEISRRDALRFSGLAAIGLAGCASEDGPEESRSPTATVVTHENSVSDPKSTTVRNPDGEPAVRSAVGSPEENLFEDEASWAYEDWLVRNAEEREALEFAGATTGVEDAEAFASETDLSEETLLVHQFNLAACETRTLDLLEWSTGRSCGEATCTHIDLEYDGTVDESECEGDSPGGPPFPEETRHNAATLIRIPARVESYGSLGSQW